jgi:hypothetical protein
LEKTLPPGMKKLAPGEEPPAPMPIPPQIKLLMDKSATEQVKQQKELVSKQVELIKIKTELIKQYKEAKETDIEIRREILKVLGQLHSMEAPTGGSPEQQMPGMNQQIPDGQQGAM